MIGLASSLTLALLATGCCARTCISIVTATVWSITTTCQCSPSTFTTTASTLSISSESARPSRSTTITSTTPAPIETLFPIRIFVQDGLLQKRSYYYIAFDPKNLGTVTQDANVAGLFSIANGYLQSDGRVVGVDTDTGFQVLQRHLNPPKLSRGWFLDPQRDIQIAGAEFTTNGNNTAGFCAFGNGTIAVEITDRPQDCTDASLAALPSKSNNPSKGLLADEQSTSSYLNHHNYFL